MFLYDISSDICINTGDTEWHHSVGQYYTCLSAEDQDFVVSILQRAATLYEGIWGNGGIALPIIWSIDIIVPTLYEWGIM